MKPEPGKRREQQLVCLSFPGAPSGFETINCSRSQGQMFAALIVAAGNSLGIKLQNLCKTYSQERITYLNSFVLTKHAQLEKRCLKVIFLVDSIQEYCYTNKH